MALHVHHLCMQAFVDVDTTVFQTPWGMTDGEIHVKLESMPSQTSEYCRHRDVSFWAALISFESILIVTESVC